MELWHGKICKRIVIPLGELEAPAFTYSRQKREHTVKWPTELFPFGVGAGEAVRFKC